MLKKLFLSEIEQEYTMIWYDDPTRFPYVRKSEYYCTSKSYRPIHSKETITYFYDGMGLFRRRHLSDVDKYLKTGFLKLIGFSHHQLLKNSELYTGIYFWLKPYDRGMPDARLCYGHPDAPPGYHPHEAVQIIKEGSL